MALGAAVLVFTVRIVAVVLDLNAPHPLHSGSPPAADRTDPGSPPAAP